MRCHKQTEKLDIANFICYRYPIHWTHNRKVHKSLIFSDLEKQHFPP